MSAQLTLQRHASGLFTAETKRSTATLGKDAIVAGLLVAALIGLVVADTYPSGRAESGPVATADPSRSAALSGTSAPDVGVFTGTYANGLPVYRLTPIEVTAVRDASAPR